MAGSYTTTMTYKTNGAPATATPPTAGGLPAETITTTYTDQGLPTTVKGIDDYLNTISYRWDSTIGQTTSGAAGKQIRQTSTFEEATSRLLKAQIDTENQTTPGTFDDKYTTSTGTRTPATSPPSPAKPVVSATRSNASSTTTYAD